MTDNKSEHQSPTTVREEPNQRPADLPPWLPDDLSQLPSTLLPPRVKKKVLDDSLNGDTP